jgi:hypothetical protein
MTCTDATVKEPAHDAGRLASASADGAPHLVPLSFDWDGWDWATPATCP